MSGNTCITHAKCSYQYPTARATLARTMALGINVSKVTEDVLKSIVRDLTPREIGVLPANAVGLPSSAQILMMDNGKFRTIGKIRIGDRVVSYNETTRRCEEAHVIDVGRIVKEQTYADCVKVADNIGTRIIVLPQTQVLCSPEPGLGAKWTFAANICEGYRITNTSGYYRHSSPFGSTSIKFVQRQGCLL